MMDPRTGLLPGQSWNVAAGPQWQARICRAGRAHVIGRALAEHAEYGPRYLDRERGDGFVFLTIGDGNPRDGWTRRWLRRPWHTFERACRAARMHSRMVIAAKRTEARAGQGGGG